MDEKEVLWRDRGKPSILYFNVFSGLGLMGFLAIFLIYRIENIPLWLNIILSLIAFIYIIFTEYTYLIVNFNPVRVTQAGVIVPKMLLSKKNSMMVRWDDISGYNFSFTLEPNMNILNLKLKDKNNIKRRVMDPKGLTDTFEVIGKLKES